MTTYARRSPAQRDLTRGRLTGQILRLAAFSGGEVGLYGLLPLILAYWTGRVGNEALAGVALGSALYVVLTSVCRGLSLGGMALIAHYVGSADDQGADQALGQTLLLLTAVTLVVALVGLATGRTLLGWMGAKRSIDRRG